MDYLMKATSILIYWFIDCKYFGQTNDLSFLYNFTIPDTSHVLEALVVASYDLPTTTVPPTTTALPITTTAPSNATVPNITTVSNVTTEQMVMTTMSSDNLSIKPMSTSTITPAPLNDATNISVSNVNNISLPYICSNSSIIPPDPNKTYGHFVKKIDVRGE